MLLLKRISDRSSSLADAPWLQGVQVQSSTALFKKVTLKVEWITKLLVSEYVLQLSDLCLCHQISAYTQVQTANWDHPFEEGGRKKKIKKKEKKEKRILADRRKKHYSRFHPCPPTHPPPLSLDCGMKKQWLFWGSVQTRQLWKN